jgi:scyllo-inositol 2-dehydrogenase (NADP+)
MKARFKSASEIKVGVIGYGGAFNMGRMHLQDMQKAGMTPRAVAEPDAARLAVAAQEFPGIETYASVDEMLQKSDVNLIVLITPHNTHAPLALKCLKAGRHVVCEKPFAITTKECDAMIAAAKKAGVMVSTFHNRHWDGSIMKALEVVKSGVIGDLVRIECHMGAWGKPGDWWRSSKSVSGGILYDWGVHPARILAAAGRFRDHRGERLRQAGILGAADPVEGRYGRGRSFCRGPVQERRLGDAVHVKHRRQPKAGMFEITGTKGSFLWEYDSHEIIVKDGEKTTVTKAKNPKEQWEKYYANVAAHLTKGEPLVITAEWARRPIHILDLAGQSAAEGRALKAKYV